MYGPMTLTPRYSDGKHKNWENDSPPMYTWNDKSVIDGVKQVLWPLYKSYDLSTHFIENLSIINQYLILNNIFLDKSYDLSTYDLKFVN